MAPQLALMLPALDPAHHGCQPQGGAQGTVPSPSVAWRLLLLLPLVAFSSMPPLPPPSLLLLLLLLSFLEFLLLVLLPLLL